jgi:hypothetical protein
VLSGLNEEIVVVLGCQPGLLVCVPGGRPSTLEVMVGSADRGVLGHGGVQPDHKWPASSRNDGSSTKDVRP